MPYSPLVSSSQRPRCYVASQFGFSEAGRYYYENVLLPALRELVEIVDPWSLIPKAEIERAEREGHIEELGQKIGELDSEAIRTSQLLVANLDGQEIDSGVAAEIGYASALGIPCFGVRSDFRKSGELSTRVNLQVEAFIRSSGGVIVSSLDELLAVLGERYA